MTAVREGFSGGSTNTRQVRRLVPPPSIGETAAAARCEPGNSKDSNKEEQEIKKMTTVREGVSGGSTNTRRTVRLVPPPSVGETAASARISLASSPTHSKASLSRTASYDAKAEPDVEASADRNLGSLTHHRPVSPFSCIRDKYREPHGGEDAPSSVASLSDREKRRLPTRMDSAKSSAMQKTKQPSQLQRGGAGNDWTDPQVSGKKNEVSDHRYRQTDTVSSLISSARDSKLELVDAFEGGNRSAQFKKPLAMSPREPVRLHFPRPPSMLDRRGALDAISESRLLEGHIPTAGCPKQELLSASTSKSNLATCKDNLQTWEGKTYITTLGPGGGYGYPHPPPFYKCEVSRKETAFYRLKCCYRVVCECCGCLCKPAEAQKDKRLQHQREKLPKVKLEGSNLFLWQPCSFPDEQMLCMAKRAGNHLQYYFAPIHKLMDPKVDHVKVCVYDFFQQGHNVISLSKTEHSLARNLLC